MGGVDHTSVREQYLVQRKVFQRLQRFLPYLKHPFKIPYVKYSIHLLEIQLRAKFECFLMNGNENGVEDVSIKIAKKFVSCYSDRIVILRTER